MMIQMRWNSHYCLLYYKKNKFQIWKFIEYLLMEMGKFTISSNFTFFLASGTILILITDILMKGKKVRFAQK